MLAVAARIPDAAARDQFADRLAHKARITEEVVRAEIRKAAVHRQTAVEERHVPPLGQVKPAERGLIWALVRDPAGRRCGARPSSRTAIWTGWRPRAILEQARSLQAWPAEALPRTLLERLSNGEAGLVDEIGRQASPPAAASDCVRALKRLRVERERADVQREMDRLQEQGAGRDEDDRMDALLRRRSRDLLAAARVADGSRKPFVADREARGSS